MPTPPQGAGGNRSRATFAFESIPHASRGLDRTMLRPVTRPTEAQGTIDLPELELALLLHDERTKSYAPWFTPADVTIKSAPALTARRSPAATEDIATGRIPPGITSPPASRTAAGSPPPFASRSFPRTS